MALSETPNILPIARNDFSLTNCSNSSFDTNSFDDLEIAQDWQILALRLYILLPHLQYFVLSTVSKASCSDN